MNSWSNNQLGWILVNLYCVTLNYVNFNFILLKYKKMMPILIFLYYLILLYMFNHIKNIKHTKQTNLIHSSGCQPSWDVVASPWCLPYLLVYREKKGKRLRYNYMIYFSMRFVVTISLVLILVPRVLTFEWFNFETTYEYLWYYFSSSPFMLSCCIYFFHLQAKLLEDKKQFKYGGVW